ncbi:hexosaminidase D-like [Oratosquilla oratoria]|uniref:hexosaminidase D-like n=1 Tax=Oratosquilla oratoria TaxID=337810 RepID=UPI003F75B9A0
MGMARAWLTHVGVVAWRSKRQVGWGVGVLVMLSVLYLQYSAGPLLPGGGDEATGHAQRALNNVRGRTSDGGGAGSHGSGSKVQKVQFVVGASGSSNQHREVQQEAEDERGGGGEGGPDGEWYQWNGQQQQPPRQQYPPNQDVIISPDEDRDKMAAVELLERHNDEHRHEAQQGLGVQAGALQLPQQLSPQEQQPQDVDGMVAPGAVWAGQVYKYNPYGEPVYGNTNRPNYIPPHRVVHFDLKGAPLKPSVYKTLVPWLKELGATAVLLEYEDMYPFRGRLSSIAAGNHYTSSQIKEIDSLCREAGLEVIPLVQTFGHLELALKHERFAHLREVPELPQAICPSLNESLWLVRSLVDQVMALHPQSRYLHIGCDEVFQIGECQRCRQKSREALFLQHVVTVARHVREKHHAIPIVWDDMLRHVSDAAMNEYNLGKLVEPMVWVYAEDVYRFVQPSVWTKFSQVFSHIWAASAFKGAFGEQLTVPNVRRHLDNNLNWLDVMAAEGGKFGSGFRGLVLTGWQRYDHFAVLCELLPSAMPSLAINLLVTSHGYFNTSLQSKLYKSLKCMQTPKYQTWLNLDSDPFLWDKFSWCFFPGSQMFKVTARLDATRRDVDAYYDRVTKSRAWITDYNRRHNFSSPMRIDEDLEELPSRLHAVSLLIKTARDALVEWFDDWTAGEWIEEQVWPMLDKLQRLQNEAESMKNVKNWPVRPLPLLPELANFGITEPPPKPRKDKDHKKVTNV